MKKLTVATLLMSLLPIANAEENLWMYSKGTDTRPQGSTEIKLSNISRLDKGSNDYTFHDIRPEIEYGITDRLTIGFEAMYFMHDYKMDEEIGPMFETAGGLGKTYKKNQLGGFEVAAKYNIYSPYKDWLGLSLGLAYEKRNRYRLDGANIDQNSYVGTIFLQKDYLDDTLIFVVNTKMELERRKSPDVLEEEIAFDLSAGVSYRFAPKWFAGLEVRMQSDYLNPEEGGVFDNTLDRSSWDISDMRLGTQHQYGTYFGPSLHYAEEKWWATVAALWQVKGGGSHHSFPASGKTGYNWDEHEKLHLGLSVGYEF